MAEAVAIERMHGAKGPEFIAEVIGVLALAGDQAGVERWKTVAAKYQQLLKGPIQ